MASLQWLQVDPGQDYYPAGTLLGVDPNTQPKAGDMAAYQKNGAAWVERHCGQAGAIGAVVVTRFH